MSPPIRTSFLPSLRLRPYLFLFWLSENPFSSIVKLQLTCSYTKPLRKCLTLPYKITTFISNTNEWSKSFYKSSTFLFFFSFSSTFFLASLLTWFPCNTIIITPKLTLTKCSITLLFLKCFRFHKSSSFLTKTCFKC